MDIESRQLQRVCKPVAGQYAEMTAFDGGLIVPGLLPGAAIDLLAVFRLFETRSKVPEG